MTFSASVKEELEGIISPARHCQIAELAAMFAFGGEIKYGAEKRLSLHFLAENESVARKYFTLLEKTFRISKVFSIGDVLYRKNNKYVVDIPGEDEAIRILQAMKYLSQDRMPITFNGLVNPLIIQKNCCKRAFLRGAFLCAGSISDPEKFYHFEIVCTSWIKAEQLQETLHSFEVEAKTVSRKKHEVVYVKEGAQIVELLGIMGAGVSLMNLENVRILKEMRNSVNRKVNCEAANINKTVSASVKQTQDIRYIQDTVGLQTLPDNLKAVAELRLKYQDASLKELGERLNPRVGKSGVNHRLRKIGRIAEELRGSKEEQV